MCVCPRLYLNAAQPQKYEHAWHKDLDPFPVTALLAASSRVPRASLMLNKYILESINT